MPLPVAGRAPVRRIAMRKKLFVSATLAVAAALVFTACEGPAGPAGSPNVQTVLFAQRGVSQIVPTSATTTVVFDTVDVDELNGYDPSTGVYTVQADGDYSVAFTIDWVEIFTNGDDIEYAIGVNSSTFVSLKLTSNGGSEGYSLSTSIPNLNAGETIEIRVRQNSGVDKAIFGSSTRANTHLAITRLE
jgi:hypothetical protein